MRSLLLGASVFALRRIAVRRAADSSSDDMFDSSDDDGDDSSFLQDRDGVLFLFFCSNFSRQLNLNFRNRAPFGTTCSGMKRLRISAGESVVGITPVYHK